MLQNDALKFTQGCFNGEPATCTYACPFHIDLRSFLKKAARGRWDTCYRDLMNTVGFPIVACSICNRRCETFCQRVYLGDDHIAINELEKACIYHTKTTVPEVYSTAAKDARIAVIGAGVCGLSAAFMLAQRSYNVDVFEKTNEIGGSLKAHPDFDIFANDFSSKFKTTRVNFRLAENVTSLAGFTDYDAVILATGRDTDIYGLASGRNAENYMTEIPGVFACGEMCGTNMCDAMAEGLEVVNYVESYIISGKPDFAKRVWKKEHCTRIVEHDGVEHSNMVPKSGEIYTKDEAKKEAARCLQCDCSSCLSICEHMRKYKKKPNKYATEVYMDSQVRPPITTHSATKAVYACNLCERCKNACPTGADLPGLFCFSRQNRFERNDYPPAFHDYWLRSQQFYSDDAAFDFAPGDEKCEYAFFPGCQLGAANPEYVEKAYAFLYEKYNAGIISSCCGAPSYWAGDIPMLDENTAKIREKWESMGRPTLVTACTSCTKMLKKVLPEAKEVSLYMLLDEAGASGDLSDYETISVFDPCSVYIAPSILKSVRNIISRSGTNISSYDSEGQCCGNGGHIRLADPELYGNIVRNRAADSEYPFMVYCVNCREVFLSQGKECRHVLDTVFNIKSDKIPHLDEKRRNALMAKVNLLEKYKNFRFVPAKHPWDNVKITVDEHVRTRMENKMIDDGDVRETIWKAEQSGIGFYDDTSNSYLAFLVRKALTYWVEYRKTDDGFEILDAYCHRMHFREED